jgi:hypothetical protein
VKRIGQQQTKHQPKHKKSYDVVLGYWVLFSLLIFFLVFGGYLDFTTWMINFNPSYPFSLRPIGYIPVPFVWFIIPFIVLGILGSIAAWAGYQLMGIPRLRAPLSHYNPFRSRKKETKNDDKTK